jgi:DNA-binding NarL/FixJ family response regulator
MGSPERPARLLIVDRSVLLAEAIASAAVGAGYEDARVVSSTEVARQLLSVRQPTVALIDLLLAAANEFELLRGIQNDFPETCVVLIVEDTVHQPLVLGASGLVYRSQGIASLLRVLEVVCGGDTAIPRDVTGLLLQALRQRPAQPRGRVQLSTRQKDVLQLVARGMTDKDISEELQISMTTVRTHLRAIFEKTATGNRTAAALWASVYFGEVGM